MNSNERLEYLRSQINAERISTAELVELQGMADQIDPGDVQLLEWAGVPEFPEEEGDAMTYNELMQKVLELFPEAIIEEDSNGEITIATGLMAPGTADSDDEKLFKLR